jgi:hypothetical protein
VTPAHAERVAIRLWAEDWRKRCRACIDMYGPDCDVGGVSVSARIDTLDIVIGYLRHRARSRKASK